MRFTSKCRGRTCAAAHAETPFFHIILLHSGMGLCPMHHAGFLFRGILQTICPHPCMLAKTADKPSQKSHGAGCSCADERIPAARGTLP